MLHLLEGDLLKSDCTFIIHQCNTKSNMGAGIAKSIAKLYPEAEKADRNFPYEPKERMGKFSKAFSKKDGRFIINLYSQFHWGKAKSEEEYEARYKAMEIGLNSLMDYVNKIETKIKSEGKSFSIKIGVPYLMGCALAGGDWNIVVGILEQVSKKYNRDIYIYKLT